MEAKFGRGYVYSLQYHIVWCVKYRKKILVVKSFKGTSARWLYRQFPELRQELWGGNVWNPSYFVATVSENTEDQVRRYIQSQNEPEPSSETGENE